jgi:hypothetical protein
MSLSQKELNGYLSKVDICIREASGGWVVVAPDERDEDSGQIAYGCHVFTSDESVLEFVKQRMAWFKRERNKGNFDHGDDDYPADPDAQPGPPTISKPKER